MMKRDDLPSDFEARREAMLGHTRSMLVEAGAGSGKTAVMAGRVAMMLAEGIDPESIAAVTFTELAAGELLHRVREFAVALSKGDVPRELQIALPHGPSAEQRAALHAALGRLDGMAVSTIHGFCQRLIMPYPVEADIDAGAGIIEAGAADGMFSDVLEQWLREEFEQPDGGSLGPYLDAGPNQLLALVRTVAGLLRKHRGNEQLPAADRAAAMLAWQQALAGFESSMQQAGIVEAKSSQALLAARGWANDAGAVKSAAGLLALELPPDLFTTTGGVRVLQNKGSWDKAVKEAGIAKAAGDAAREAVVLAYTACATALLALREHTAGEVLAGVAGALQPVLERFREQKRSAALLDFDDLIYSARALLRDHPAVRDALAQRYAHVLVDEFQDTDAMQLEIFWTLCGEPSGANPADWGARQIRPGALFLVGDPKQAIYRFRGADIAAYQSAREALCRQDPDAVLTISTNFRSQEQILEHVNTCFAQPLSQHGQPGFQSLQAFGTAGDGPCVVALDVPEGGGRSDGRRDSEAEAVADFCLSVVGKLSVRDRRSGEMRPCRASDIALLAPGSTDLWRYEAALEQRGFAVASQAGKGFFRRQEVQDLVALARVLADADDTVAFGALLRGPLVGLTEEELLDVVQQLPRDGAALPRLTVRSNPDDITHPLLRQLLQQLAPLRARAASTTPALLLARAVADLRVREILQQRHAGRGQRALANVDRFLVMAGAYAVRGLAAFAADVSAAWSEGRGEVEGARDAGEDAITLNTMHSSKGLEWPLVIPVNGGTELMAADSEFLERASATLYCKVFGVAPPGYAAASEKEKADLAHERVRLWYVALTRARELLVLPRSADGAAERSWSGVMDLGLAGLEPFEAPAAMPPAAVVPAAAAPAAALAPLGPQRSIRWRNPSRGEGEAGALESEESVESRIDASYAKVGVQGSHYRGTVIHKLLEEVLTGETTSNALEQRAHELLPQLGILPCSDPALGPAPAEIAACVQATLQLPVIAQLLPSLRPEYALGQSGTTGLEENVWTGVADAISYDAQGRPGVVLDWKSDVNPSAALVQQYCQQVKAYMQMAGASQGLVVLVSTGQVIEV